MGGEMDRVWIGLGGLAGATAVAMAAYLAHGLPPDAPALARQQLGSALQMQGWHALALLAVGLWAARGGWPAHAAGAAFALGLLLFCGDVYLLGLRHVSLGMAPAGGVLLILGWLLLAFSAVR
jgi:uncharacterized membrane protein YgdD (TMEM256/DUF423 family)